MRSSVSTRGISMVCMLDLSVGHSVSSRHTFTGEYRGGSRVRRVTGRCEQGALRDLPYRVRDRQYPGRLLIGANATSSISSSNSR